MFVPVACLKCGKPFQVAAADAGREVACPWCHASTAALPIAASPPDSGGLTSPGSPAPLSLDDEPAPPKPAAPRKPFPLVRVVVIAGLSALAFALTLGVLLLARGYGAGRVADSAWSPFTPPDGSFTVLLPGTAAEEALDANPSAPELTGGKRYVVRGWYSKTTTFAGWLDLDPAWAKQSAADRDGALTLGLVGAELDRQKAWLGGKTAKDATVRFNAMLGTEVLLDTPRGKAVVRLMVSADGARPRLYFLGFESSAATPEDPAVRKLFNSFKVVK